MSNFEYASDPLIITSGNTTLSVKIADSVGNEQATLQAEKYGDGAAIDIRGVVQTMFRNEQTEYSLRPDIISIYTDRLLQVPCKIKVDDGAPADYTFLRGVHQLGEPSNRPIIATRLGVETTNDQLVDIHIKARYYKDYPLCLTLTHGDQCDMIINQQDTVYQSQYASHVCLSPSTNVDVDIRDYDTWVYIEFNSKAVPAHPFYIRWINDRAGWDTWMFACNQKRTRQLTANDYFERFESKGEQYAYHKAGAELVEVSTGRVTADEREAISRLVYSPLVQWYKEGYGWVNIQVDKADTEWMTANPTDELVMSFVLPTPQINK